MVGQRNEARHRTFWVSLTSSSWKYDKVVGDPARVSVLERIRPTWSRSVTFHEPMGPPLMVNVSLFVSQNALKSQSRL